LSLLSGKGDDNLWPVSFSEFLNGQRAARMGRFKLICKGFSPALFDLKTDPKETTDLSAKLPIALSALRDALGLHLGGLGTVDGGGSKKKLFSHEKESVTIDSETRRQLEALGYMGKAAKTDTDTE
jgi:hypothetical protein